MAWIELKAVDGHSMQAWCASPPAGQAKRGAIVVLQEIFGVNGHIRDLCDALAREGWVAVAPSLFDRAARSQDLGYDAQGVARGAELKGLVGDDRALLDVQAAIDWAGRSGARVAVMGFCWGGTLAWLAAARLAGLGAAVAYYGTGIASHLDQMPRVPMLLHFGEQDAHIPPGHVDRIAETWPDIPLYRYPTGHGFNCSARPAFHAPSAALAAARTREFLKESLPC